MIVTAKSQKKRAFHILYESLKDNPAVLNAVKKDGRINRRAKFLLRYIVNLAYRNHGLFMTDCGTGAAVAMAYNKVKTGIGGYWDQLLFALFGAGLKKVRPILNKEAYLNSIRPVDKKYFYIWLMAVAPEARGKGAFMKLSREIQNRASLLNYDLYFETSVIRNRGLYKAVGAEIYHQFELEKGKTEYCFRFSTSRDNLRG